MLPIFINVALEPYGAWRGKAVSAHGNTLPAVPGATPCTCSAVTNRGEFTQPNHVLWSCCGWNARSDAPNAPPCACVTPSRSAARLGVCAPPPTAQPVAAQRRLRTHKERHFGEAKHHRNWCFSDAIFKCFVGWCGKQIDVFDDGMVFLNCRRAGREGANRHGVRRCG